MMDRIHRLWAKTSKENEGFHPVLYHMVDVGHVAQVLLGDDVTPRWKNTFQCVYGTDLKLGEIPWLVSLHDIGKISAAFQLHVGEQESRLRKEGFSFGEWNNKDKLSHTLIGSAFILSHFQDIATDISDSMNDVIGEVVGGHHGRYLKKSDTIAARKRLLVYEPKEWQEMRLSGCNILQKVFMPILPLNIQQPAHLSSAVMALTGFVILCDWLASDQNYFWPEDEVTWEKYLSISRKRAQKAIQAAGLAGNVNSKKDTRFTIVFPINTPRPLQNAIDQIPDELLSVPCLVVIEAPTGEGKTEAALALGHRIGRLRGTEEFYYALPTTATSNQMNNRLQKYLINNLEIPSKIRLVHSQAFLNEDDHSLEPLFGGDNNEAKQSLVWFAPKKKALLAPFGVGTVDQIELAALNTKHGALRMIGLAGKVIIIDEVHAYDVYMTTIIERLLQWLNVLGASVIVLSATLPISRKYALVNAFSEQRNDHKISIDYPSLSVFSDKGSHLVTPPAYQQNRKITIHPIHYDEDQYREKADFMYDLVKSGGCVCWITNTVRRAQALYKAYKERDYGGVDVTLIHSRFPLRDRLRIENELTQKYGPEGKRPHHGIVIGTQVLEQSLDLDFDGMITDLAPVDLLLQRTGRMHRHQRDRIHIFAKPRLWINTILDQCGEPDLRIDKIIYDEYILLKTWELFFSKNEIHLPEDYRAFIETVYKSDILEKEHPLYNAWRHLQKKQAFARAEANIRLLPQPQADELFSIFLNWNFDEEDDDASENKSAWIIAKTRLGSESLHIIPLTMTEAGIFCYGIEETIKDLGSIPRSMQIDMLRSAIVIGNHIAIQALKNVEAPKASALKRSALLKGCLPLWLVDGKSEIEWNGKKVLFHLNDEFGLEITIEG